MKRMLILLLALLLILPAHAEENIGNKLAGAMYRIVLRTGEGDVPLGSGVLFVQKDLLLTAEACCQEGSLYAIGLDGEFPIVYGERALGGGVAILQMASQSAGEPLMLAGYESSVLPWLFGASAEGKLANLPLQGVIDSRFGDLDAIVLRSAEGLLPGAIVADNHGDIIALVVAQQAEGRGVYIALDPNGILTTINTHADDSFPSAGAQWEDGALAITWEDGARQGGQYCIIVTSENNTYYTTFTEDAEARSTSLLLPPGHVYQWQLQWVPDGEEPEPVWAKMTETHITAEPLTAYGFRQECGLVNGPKGLASAEELPVLTRVTAAVVQDENTDMYLQALNTYDVEETIECPMMVELTAPDGQFFFESYAYTFAQEYEAHDSYAIPVEGLFEICMEFSGGTLPTGDYTLRYIIDGKVAGECTFTLEE